MNRKDARKIAETITNLQLESMFEVAKIIITNWEQVSNVNPSMTKGTAWNVLAKDFDVNHSYHILAKTNMIREFGEFLPDYLKPNKPKKQKSDIRIIHQDPQFNLK